MSFGVWNKIKKGFSKVKSKVAPLVKKGINYVKDHPEIISKAHTHTVCVPYYKAAPYNISHTKIFSRAKYNRVI